MESMPSELLYLIFEQLEETNLSSRPFARELAASENDEYGWPQLLDCSRCAICNFRLTSRRFYKSSIKSFAYILGYRTFRITKTGLADLRGILKYPGLVPQMHTITIGGAVFKSVDRKRLVRSLLERMENKEFSTRLLKSYESASEWKCEGVLACDPPQTAYLFKETLNNLTSLKTLRIVLNDRLTEDEYLGSWLQPADLVLVRNTIASNYDLARKFNRPYRSPRIPVSPMETLVDFLGPTAKRVQDVRVQPGETVFPSEMNKIVPSSPTLSGLKVLRIDINIARLVDDARRFSDTDQPKYLHVLCQLPNLTTLYLKVFKSNNEVAKGLGSSRLLKVLRTRTQLRELSLTGSLSFVANDLVDLISSPRSSVQSLVLNKVALHVGDWTVFATQAAQLKSSLRFLYIQDPKNKKGLGIPTPFSSEVKIDIERKISAAVYLGADGQELAFRRSQEGK